MTTECLPQQIEFQSLGRRKIMGDFTVGYVSSDAGALTLREVDKCLGLIKEFSSCFTDFRHPDYIEHPLKDLLAQRIYGLCLGYDDLNDHDVLRTDPLFATAVGKPDPTGLSRWREEDKGCALAGKSTLNRLELGSPDSVPFKSSDKKIICDPEKVADFFVTTFLNSYEEAPEELILDFDATDVLLHGHQEGRFFHGYYGSYCYLPLYVFCGSHLLLAKLRTSDREAADGTTQELDRIVTLIRQRWPDVRIIVRGDSGFCRDAIMSFCESHDVKYILGIARNNRLVKELKEALGRVKANYMSGSGETREYVDFSYKPLKTWDDKRRVVGKAEYLSKGENPRFVITNFSKDEYEAQALYEDLYCPRGDMENRIKEQQLCLFADRTSTYQMSSNQLRLWFSAVAYVLMNELRRRYLKGTQLAQAQCSTIRLKLFKIGALITVSVRRIYIQMSSTYPYKDMFHKIMLNLKGCYG